MVVDVPRYSHVQSPMSPGIRTYHLREFGIPEENTVEVLVTSGNLLSEESTIKNPRLGLVYTLVGDENPMRPI